MSFGLGHDLPHVCFVRNVRLHYQHFAAGCFDSAQLTNFSAECVGRGINRERRVAIEIGGRGEGNRVELSAMAFHARVRRRIRDAVGVRPVADAVRVEIESQDRPVIVGRQLRAQVRLGRHLLRHEVGDVADDPIDRDARTEVHVGGIRRRWQVRTVEMQLLPRRAGLDHRFGSAEHNRIVHEILRDHGATSLIKSKSMLTEECGFRAYMASVGVKVIETDLGERIQQLDNEDPSHVVVPAVHKLRTDVAQVFAKTLGTDPGNSDVHYLAEAQREATRPLILKADAGMTGANFVVAETGTFVVCTNEGNADLSANVPKLHIASIGIEKIIPRLEHLAVLVRLLSRSALGSPMTQYTSHFRGPRAGGEMHVVLVDNGRSERLADERFWPSLKCIRCGACMNTCPVYRRSGGLSYGSTYMGPIVIIVMPTFDLRRHSELPFASTINGSCSNVCPVQIDIHEQIYQWREVMDAKGEFSTTKKAAMKVAGRAMRTTRSRRSPCRALPSAVLCVLDADSSTRPDSGRAGSA